MRRNASGACSARCSARDATAPCARCSEVKPSDFPRDAKFRDPRTPPFRDESGAYHVFGYADVMRVLLNRDDAFSRDPAPWLPEGPHHIALDFMWAVEPFTLDGDGGRHDALRGVVEPWSRT